MSSLEILLDNLKRHYKTESIRSLAVKMNYSEYITLNWSSGRSIPSIKHLNDIAYQIGVEVSELLVENNNFTIESPIWRDNVKITLKNNLGRLRLEKDIHENFFNKDITDEYQMSYRAFLRYINNQNKRVNLSILDRLARIFEVEPYKLLEREIKNEKEDSY